MNRLLLALAFALPAMCQSPGERGIVANAASPHVRLKALDLDDVRWTRGFWGERFDIFRRNTLPVILRALEDPASGAQYLSFRKTTGRGGDTLDVKRPNWSSDGDVYKGNLSFHDQSAWAVRAAWWM